MLSAKQSAFWQAPEPATLEHASSLLLQQKIQEHIQRLDVNVLSYALESLQQPDDLGAREAVYREESHLIGYRTYEQKHLTAWFSVFLEQFLEENIRKILAFPDDELKTFLEAIGVLDNSTLTDNLIKFCNKEPKLVALWKEKFHTLTKTENADPTAPVFQPLYHEPNATVQQTFQITHLHLSIGRLLYIRGLRLSSAAARLSSTHPWSEEYLEQAKKYYKRAATQYYSANASIAYFYFIKERLASLSKDSAAPVQISTFREYFQNLCTIYGAPGYLLTAIYGYQEFCYWWGKVGDKVKAGEALLKAYAILHIGLDSTILASSENQFHDIMSTQKHYYEWIRVMFGVDAKVPDDQIRTKILGRYKRILMEFDPTLLSQLKVEEQLEKVRKETITELAGTAARYSLSA